MLSCRRSAVQTRQLRVANWPGSLTGECVHALCFPFVDSLGLTMWQGCAFTASRKHRRKTVHTLLKVLLTCGCESHDLSRPGGLCPVTYARPSARTEKHTLGLVEGLGYKREMWQEKAEPILVSFSVRGGIVLHFCSLQCNIQLGYFDEDVQRSSEGPKVQQQQQWKCVCVRGRYHGEIESPWEVTGLVLQKTFLYASIRGTKKNGANCTGEYTLDICVPPKYVSPLQGPCRLINIALSETRIQTSVE